MPTVAVIDDDAAFIGFMHEALEFEGYQALSARTAREAYDLIIHALPDIITLDIRLEHRQAGLVLLDLLQSHPQARDIPIIICSGDIPLLREKQARLQKKGFQVLAKPFTLDQLFAAVETAVQQRMLNTAGETTICVVPHDAQTTVLELA